VTDTHPSIEQKTDDYNLNGAVKRITRKNGHPQLLRPEISEQLLTFISQSPSLFLEPHSTMTTHLDNLHLRPIAGRRTHPKVSTQGSSDGCTMTCRRSGFSTQVCFGASGREPSGRTSLMIDCNQQSMSFQGIELLFSGLPVLL
jgi:hypothetical protein